MVTAKGSDMSGPTIETSRRRLRAGFPLASLVLLVTAFACLFASTNVELWREQLVWLKEDWPWRVVALFGGAAFVGLLIGCRYLFVGGVSWRTRLLAPLAGIMAGEIGVLILVAPG